MTAYDIIDKKKYGKRLDDEEIVYFIENYTKGNIPDYQASALMMAIWFNSMDTRELAVMTQCMASSGDILELTDMPGATADKHSTGGVGDKTTLITAPIAASCGLCVAKMSGRGLGHTGGTIDKLESIPGFQSSLTPERFIGQTREIGIALSGQTGNLAPADKLLYALRDVTATVDSLPLIAASVMSKKLAAGAESIILDVKCGAGAFMKTAEQSKHLARVMVEIGKSAGRRVGALVTDMDTPLGFAIGNALEVREAAQTLMGHGPGDTTRLSVELTASMLYLSGRGNIDECRAQANRALESGRAFEKLCEMVRAQGGDTRCLEQPERLELSPVTAYLTAPRDGYIVKMNALECGAAARMLGAGREKKGDSIDMGAGILLMKKTGDSVGRGEAVARLYTSSASLLEPALARLENAYEYGGDAPRRSALIMARIFDDNGSCGKAHL